MPRKPRKKEIVRDDFASRVIEPRRSGADPLPPLAMGGRTEVMMRTFHGLLLVFLLCVVPPVWAATYYVRTNGTASGCPANTDTVAGSRNTITGGIACLGGPGDTLIVHGGNYAEQAGDFANVSGNDYGSGAMTVKAAPGETVWVGRLNVYPSVDRRAMWLIIDGINIDGAALWPDATGVGMYIAGDRVRVQNAEIRNTGSTGINMTGAAAEYGEFINLNVHHCNCTAISGGVPCGQSYYIIGNNNLIDGGEAHHNGHDGIQFRHGGGGQPNNSIVRNVKIYDNPAAGLEFHGGESNNLAYNNVIWNTGIGLWDAGSNNQYYNNTVYGNNSGGIVCAPGQSFGINARNNLLFGNSVPADACPSLPSDNMTSDPSFVDAPGRDFHLRNDSPAINAGVNLEGIPSADMEGNPRPEPGGTQKDVGAYECQNLEGASCGGSPPQPPPGTIVASDDFEAHV
jgi:Right handed beta helix region